MRAVAALLVTTACIAPAAHASTSARTLRDSPLLARIGAIDAPGVEICDYDEAGNIAFAVAGARVILVHLGDGASPRAVREIDFAPFCGFPDGMPGEVTHLALDPLRRGFGAATVVPADRSGVPGAVVLFSTRTGRPLARFVVGYNPDANAFSPDGAWLLVANEGEPTVTDRGVLVDPPGSLSVVSLAGVESEFDCPRLTQARVTTVYFDGEALERAIARSNDDPLAAFLRVHPRHRMSPTLDLEPEYIAFVGDTAYITLQENNAIARFDLSTMRIEGIDGPGLRRLRLDPSDDDGPGAAWETVHAAPMPDQLASFTIEGRSYILTPNEGDDRGRFGRANNPLGDEIRLLELARTGRARSELRERVESTPSLHALKVCAHSGDLNADGAIDEPVALGARGASVWSVEPDGSLLLVADTEDLFERTLATLAPDLFNANAGQRREARSSSRGPEPEGVVIGRVGDRTLAFIGLERPGAIAVLDLTSPDRPALVELHMSADEGDYAPEGMRFIPAAHSPTGKPLLLTAFEVSGTLVVYEIDDSEDSVNSARDPRAASR